MEQFRNLLYKIYEHTEWEALWDDYSTQWKKKSSEFLQKRADNKDIRDENLTLLISYGDSIKKTDKSEKPLQSLYRFLDEVCDCSISGVHILPYFPYTSDDGFSISEYRQVREDLGDWRDIERLSSEYHLMTDLVLNHCSSKHPWFQKFLKDESPYDEYFVTGDVNADYSAVVRPRPHFILSEYKTKTRTRHVWTTFSRDQVDINFANPQVLFEMLDIMLEYALDHASRLVRLDAIAYLWKEIGTSCIHHEKTHLVVKLMRAILDHYAPNTIIITETNVPHEENISYFGDNDEAQMIYQFPLPPLLLYSMITESTGHLKKWSSQLEQPSKEISYFNFCASHDGIGVTPTHGILSDKERAHMIEVVKKRGGLVSYKATDTGEIPYELNINYFSAVADKELPNKERAHIFLASQSVLLSMPGVPGVYIHSLLGSDNWNHGVKETGHNRSINRQSLDYDKIVDEVGESESLRNLVFHGYLKMIQARSKSTAFNPAAGFQILDGEDGIFALIRDGKAIGSNEKVLCLVNLTSREIVQSFDYNLLPWAGGGEDLIDGDIVFFNKEKTNVGKSVATVAVEPYEIHWLKFCD